MGFFDALFGKNNDTGQPAGGAPRLAYDVQSRPANADEQAIARYRYMLQSAQPEQIEAAHAEAFARLTPPQRELALQQMAGAIPENERANLSDDPRALARAATRAEIREPGTMERVMGNRNAGGGMMGGMGGMGGMLAGSLLMSVAGGFIGSSIAHSFFSDAGNEQGFQGSPEAAGVEDGASDYNGSDFQEAGRMSDADPMGDPGLDSGGFAETGFDDFVGDFGGDF